MKKKVLAASAAFALSLSSMSAQAALIEVWQSASQLTTLADADALIASGHADFVDDYNGLIDFDDLGDGSTGVSGLNLPWPGNVTTDFAARITGAIDVVSDTLWGIFVNHDDGTRVTLNGIDIIVADGLADNRLSGSQTNAPLHAGANLVEIVFFERAGGASLEFYAGPARTVGPDDLAGLRTVPTPAPLLLLGLGLAGIGLARRRAS